MLELITVTIPIEMFTVNISVSNCAASVHFNSDGNCGSIAVPQQASLKASLREHVIYSGRPLY